ncbi:hypothetical protein Acr_00g0102200 [Actinidia rufa]|uniref:Uncharacterized protein n=1 Tax=Actinidia rufa TaxID=165716 RepID=A0A7J0E089_9ERIC|nr:hypothetical protein Acr_00g0102200 [Actinidia rufa]
MVISASCTTAEAGASAAPPVQPAGRRSASHSPAALYASPASPLCPLFLHFPNGASDFARSDHQIHRLDGRYFIRFSLVRVKRAVNVAIGSCATSSAWRLTLDLVTRVDTSHATYEFGSSEVRD